jgi:hypothetical protein
MSKIQEQKNIQTTVYNKCNSLEEFTAAAEALASKDPNTRYTIKYKNTTGQVVMSITNDKIVIHTRLTFLSCTNSPQTNMAT